MSVHLESFGWFNTGDLGESGIRICEADDIVADFSGGCYALPTGDKWNARSAFEHAGFVTVDHTTADRGGMAHRGAIVSRKNDQSVFQQAEFLYLGNNSSYLFIHILDIVLIELFAIGFFEIGIRCFLNGCVYQVHCIIEKEWFVLMSANEIKAEVLNYIWAVGSFGKIQFGTVFDVLRFPKPATGSVIGKIFIKSPFAGSLTNLSPFAGLGGGITGLFQELGHGIFAG